MTYALLHDHDAENQTVRDIRAKEKADRRVSLSRQECQLAGNWGATTQIEKENAGKLRSYVDGMALADPIDAKSIRIRAIAATADIDADRSRFLAQCWPRLDPTKIKLLMNHDPERVAGHINAIEVDALGRVVVTCTVTDPYAMRLPAMSISARIGGFVIRHSDSPTLFAGEITAVTEVNECSLTSTPSNRRCLVLERTIPSPADLRHQEMLDRNSADAGNGDALRDKAA